jgi:hypothetical protein
MIVAGIYHVWYLITNPDGRQMFKDMLPDWKDATDVRDALLYYTGLSEQRPMFRRFSYAEKAEYWALVWGTFVMAGTGLMAWFKVLVGQRVPGWWIDVALVRGDSGYAGHHRLALLRGHLRSRRLSDKLGVVRWQDVDRALRARASVGCSGDPEGGCWRDRRGSTNSSGRNR